MNNQTCHTASQGLQQHIPPMILYQQALQEGVWNPNEIDFTQDIKDWWNFNAAEQDLILRLTSIFRSGLEAIILNMLPMVEAVSYLGDLEEVFFLITTLFDESKHTAFFSRILDEVAQVESDLDQYCTQNFRVLLFDILPEAIDTLRQDRSPAALAYATATGQIVIKGVLAATGAHVLFKILIERQLMPGMQSGMRLINQDLSRHTRYGIFLLSRLVAENKDLWPASEERISSLLAHAVSVVGEVCACYDPIPFGLIADDYVNYAVDQFNHHFELVQRARGATLDEIYRISTQAIYEFWPNKTGNSNTSARI